MKIKMNRISIRKKVWKRLKKDYSINSKQGRFSEFDMNSAIDFTIDEALKEWKIKTPYHIYVKNVIVWLKLLMDIAASVNIIRDRKWQTQNLKR